MERLFRVHWLPPITPFMLYVVQELAVVGSFHKYFPVMGVWVQQSLPAFWKLQTHPRQYERFVTQQKRWGYIAFQTEAKAAAIHR